MNTARILLASSVSAIGVFVVMQACGGELTVGYDDAGNYHTADGEVFHYGSGCVGFDASVYLMDGALACDSSGSDPYCTSLVVPPTLSQYYVSFCVNAVCSGPQWGIDAGADTFEFPPCEPGTAGDDYCVAYLDRFVTHGHVVAHCERTGNTGGACFANVYPGCYGVTAPVPFHVQESDGAIDCVNPCQP